MTLEIDRSSAALQLMNMNTILTNTAADICTAKTAIEAYIDTAELQGQTYDSIRAHYSTLHFPVLRGMISYIDEMLAANNIYNTNLGVLKACYLNETTLYRQLQIAKAANVAATSPALSLFHGLTQNIVHNIQEKMDSLYHFESDTQGVYQGAQRILEDVKKGITLIKTSVYDSEDQAFSHPPGTDLNMGWRERLEAIYKEKQKNGMKALVFTGDQASVKGFDPCYAYSRDPVNLGTGNFIYAYEDLNISGLCPLSFRRFYNAQDIRAGVLGTGWVHNYGVRLKIERDRLILAQEDGQEETYVRVAKGCYVNGNTGLDSIRTAGETYMYTTPEQTRHIFDADGREQKRQDAHNNSIGFRYDDKGRLVQAKSISGTLRYTYRGDGHLVRVTDHIGRAIHLTYDEATGNLTCVTDPAGHTLQYTCNSQNKIIAVTNARSIQSIQNDYGFRSRITCQNFPDGSSMRYRYDDAGRAVTLIEQNGNPITYVHDHKYRNIKTVYQNGTEEYTYNSQNKRTRRKDRLGYVTRFGYDPRGNLTQIKDALCNIFEYTYTQHNKLQSFSVNGTLKFKHQYDAKGNLIQTRDALQGEKHFTYNAQGLPITATQPDGSTRQFTYDTTGNLTAVTNAMGYTTHYEYDQLNRVIQTGDPNGNITQYAYDSCGNLIRVINAEGRERSYIYNENNKITQITDFNGSIHRQEYVCLNKPSKIIDALGHETRLEYDAMWNIKKRIDPNGAETRYTYTLYNQVESVTNPLGATVRYEYDANGNRTKAIGPQGQETIYAYDALNRMTEVTEPDGAATQYVYNPENRITQITNAAGHTTRYDYDAAGHKIRETDPKGHITHITYTLLGQIETITNAQGGVVRWDYYPGGQTRRIVLPEGECQTYEYDGNGNIVRVTDASGSVTTLDYDVLNRIIQTTDPLGHSKLFAYDAVGNIIEATDENGHKTFYAYSLLGDIIEVIDALGHSTKYGYDKMRQLSRIEQYRLIDDTLATLKGMEKQTGPVRLVTTYERDKAGAITAVHAPAGTTRFGYDSLGNVVSKTDEDGQETLYEYNRANKLSKLVYADGRTVEFTYTPLRQLAEMKDWLGVTALTHDVLGRVEKITDFAGATVEYHWDELSQRTRITYPGLSEVPGASEATAASGGAFADKNSHSDKGGSAATVRYSYDRSGRLINVGSIQGETRYRYNAMGWLSRMERPDNIISCYEYAPTGKLSGLTHMRKQETSAGPPAETILDRFLYTCDPAGHITRIDKHRRDMTADVRELPVDCGVFEYTYDALGRLTSAIHGGRKKEYVYDSLSNRLASFEAGRVIRHEYNAANQLIRTWDSDSAHDSGKGACEEYRYDRRGNLTEILAGGITRSSFAFDSANMMIQAITEKGQAKYAYDGFRNRVRRLEWFADPARLTAWGTKKKDLVRETRFILDMTLPYNNLLMTQQHGGRTQSYIWGTDLLGSVEAGAGTDAGTQILHYLTDPLGSPVRLVGNENNGKSLPLAYDEFGVPLVDSTEGIGDNLFGFTGYQREEISGMYYAQARYYEPMSGRFISPDIYPGTVTQTSSLNRFTYCRNNPLVYVDKDGLFPALADIWKTGTKVAGEVFSNPFNTDETKVLNSKYFSWYKGQPVVRANCPSGRSFSLGIMFLDPSVQPSADPEVAEGSANTIRHEYGHFVQLAVMGFNPLHYLGAIGIPSITSRVKGDLYYSQPWEYTADKLGGVDPSVRDIDGDPLTIDSYTPDAEAKGWDYFWKHIISGCAF